MRNNNYNQFHDEQNNLPFDQFPPANHENNDLDILRENTLLQEQLENDIIGNEVF